MTVFTLEDTAIVSQPTIVCNLSCNSIRSLTLSTELVPLYSQDFLHIRCTKDDRYVNRYIVSQYGKFQVSQIPKFFRHEFTEKCMVNALLIVSCTSCDIGLKLIQLDSAKGM